MKVAILLLTIAALNFVWFFQISCVIGGNALIGKVDADSYFVGNHGKFTEVSSWVWHYSRIHTYSTWVTHGLAFVAIWISIAEQKRTAGSREEAS